LLRASEEFCTADAIKARVHRGNRRYDRHGTCIVGLEAAARKSSSQLRPIRTVGRKATGGSMPGQQSDKLWRDQRDKEMT
jgi:hypothetical protein